MKINKIMVMCLAAAPLVALTSCNDFLDTMPDNRTELNTPEKIT